MDWGHCDRVARECCATINDAARETEDITVIREGVVARKALSELLRDLARIDDTDEIENLFGITQLIAGHDHLIAQGQPGYSASTLAAVEQLNDGRKTLGWLREPDVYKEYVAGVHTAAKYRKEGLPLDKMRQGLRSHISRVANAMGAMALAEDRAELYACQRGLVRRIERLYIRLQHRALYPDNARKTDAPNPDNR